MKKIWIFFSLLFICFWNVFAQNTTLKYGSYLSQSGIVTVVWLENSNTTTFIWLNTENTLPIESVPLGTTQWLWKIYLFDKSTSKVYSQIIFESSLTDFEVKNNFIYATTQDETLVLTLKWTILATQPAAKMISVDDIGNYVIYTYDGRLLSYDRNHNLKFEKNISKTSVEDIALDSVSGRILLVWYDTKRLNNGNQIQIAFLQAYDLSGLSVYKLFGFEGSDLAQYPESTQLYKIHLWKNWKAYILWETTGVQSIFQYNGKGLAGTESLIYGDYFNQLSKIEHTTLAYYARIYTFDGTIEKAQLAVSRSSDTTSDSYFVKNGNIYSDDKWNVFIAGMNTYSLPDRENITINNQKIAPYAWGDGSLQWLNADLTQRYFWTTFWKIGSPKTQMHDVVITNDNTVIAVWSITSGEIFTTTWALFSTVQTGVNAFMVMFDLNTQNVLPKFGENNIPYSGSVIPSLPSWNGWWTSSTTNSSSSGKSLTYEQYMNNILKDPKYTNKQKLSEYIFPERYTPKLPATKRVYVLLSGKFNKKKQEFLAQHGDTITQAQLDIFKKYTQSLYELVLAIDGKKSKAKIQELYKVFIKDYSQLMKLK